MLVIAGAGIAGLSLLYHLAEQGYNKKITLIDKVGIGKRKVSMFVFKEKLIELLPILEQLDPMEYTENLCNSYSYSMVEDAGLIDYRTITQENVAAIVDYEKLCTILYKHAQNHLNISFVKGKISKSNGQIVIDDKQLDYDLFIDAMGYHSPFASKYKRPNRYYQLFVREYQNIPENLKDNIRMIVNITKGGCWIYPNGNNSGYEVGVGLLTCEPKMTAHDKTVLHDAMEEIEQKISIPGGDRTKSYYGTFAMEPLKKLFLAKERILRVGDSVGMIDSYTGTGVLVIIEEMRHLAEQIKQYRMLKRAAFTYNEGWQTRLKEYYLGRTARSMVMFGKHMNDDRWRKVLIKRANADPNDVIKKASGSGKHGFWFNVKLLHPRVLWDFMSTKRQLKKNLRNNNRLILI